MVGKMAEPYGIFTMSEFEEVARKIIKQQNEIDRLRLTDKERESIEWVAQHAAAFGLHENAATLRGLLARTGSEQ